MKRGFTLLEAVLYLAIAGIVIYFISGFAFNAIFGKAKIESIQEVSEGSRSVLDQISSAISNASEINGLEVDVPVSPSQIPTDGLVAYWPFDGNANDSVGGNNGTIYGATATTGVKGLANTSYAFNGTGSYINVGNAVSLNPQYLSVSFWVKPNSFSSHRAFISHRSSASTGQFFAFQLNGNNLTFDTFADGAQNRWSTGYNTPIGGWKHLVLTYDGANKNFYLDGVLNAGPMNHDSGLMVAATNDMVFGKDSLSDQYFFDGSLDEIRIYNRALTADEVLTIYNEEKP